MDIKVQITGKPKAEALGSLRLAVDFRLFAFIFVAQQKFWWKTRTNFRLLLAGASVF
jgi:hypothetical protein